jgi:CHAT domain-containing protein
MGDQDRTHFDRHFLASPERRTHLRLTENLRKLSAADAKKTAPQTAKRRWFDAFLLPSNQWLRFAAATLLLITAGLAVWRFVIYTSDADKGLAQLQLAYKGQRPTESRSSAGFDYAPLIETRGGPSTASDKTALARAERYLLDARAESADAKAHHALGLYHLAAGSHDKALAEFDLALKSAPMNAAIHSDIGAAYFEKAKRSEFEQKPGEVMEYLALALKSNDRALEIDPAFLPALFDRALILQMMSLPGEARGAWEKYLEVDTASPWADEARRGLDKLKTQSSQQLDRSTVRNDFIEAQAARDDVRALKIASQTKELVTGVMLSIQFAREVAGGDPASSLDRAQSLSAFAYLGELEKQNNGDPFFVELADFYASADSASRNNLFQGHEKLREAHELILKADFTKALVASELAAEIFLTAGSRWDAAVADHRSAFCLTNLNRIAESNERLKKLSVASRMRGYLWLEGFTETWIGNNFALLGEQSRALGHSQKALEIANGIGDTYNLLRVHNQMTAEYWRIGDSERALGAVRLSLNKPDLYFLSARQKARNLLFGTEACFRFGHNAAAAAFSREALRVAREEVKDKWLGHTVQTQLAVISADAGKYPLAFEAVDRSVETANSFEDAVMRQRLDTRSRLTAASVQRYSGDFAAAARNYDQVINEYKDANFSLTKYEAHKGRLLCLIEQNQDDVVEREMPELLRVFDENRQTIFAEADRNTFFDREQNVYDIATAFAYTQLGKPELAFEYAENSRARSLLSSIRNGPEKTAKPLVLAEIRERMPADVQIIYFAVLEKSVLAWHISGSTVFTAAQPVGMDALDERIRGYMELLTARKDLKSSAEDLHKLLISPLAGVLEPGKAICVIADKSLLRLPFASLVSPETGKYLIEEYPLIYAPSASVFIEETVIARGKGMHSDETVLSIGNPPFSRTEYPTLADLPAAAREANEVKAIYPATRLLTGLDANKQRIIHQLGNASVVHFAGHYVPNAKFPARSKLLLPPDDLMLEEIPAYAIKDLRLVVLSACDTANGRFYNGEGMIGASRAFLSMGVPMVVASQWPVDSEATAELMVDFHRQRKEAELLTPVALQHSQVNMLNGENTRFRAPFYWASFMPIGGYTNY